MASYFTLNTNIELACFVVAFACLRKDISYTWKSIIILLFITCTTEITGIYVKHLYLADRAHIHSNLWLYNIFLVVQVLFISFMFAHLLKPYFKSFALIAPALLAFIVLFIYEIFNHGVYVYNELSYTTAMVIFIILSLIYYYFLMKDDKLVNLLYSSGFWWVAGVLFFHFGVTACTIFSSKLSSIIITPKHFLTYYIYNALNLILYSCWSYSFICRKWETRKLKSSSF